MHYKIENILEQATCFKKGYNIFLQKKQKKSLMKKSKRNRCIMVEIKCQRAL